MTEREYMKARGLKLLKQYKHYILKAESTRGGDFANLKGFLISVHRGEDYIGGDMYLPVSILRGKTSGTNHHHYRIDKHTKEVRWV